MAPGASLARLVEIMDRLLAPDGCPWDRDQTLESLRPFLVEETYEVLDALARGDVPGHCEELGDLLMQIVFHAAIRRSEGAFDIDAVVAGIADKLVHRHPHVFGDQRGVDTPAQVLAQWEEIKAKEKAAKGVTTKRTLAGVKPGPALVRAQAIGKRCGKVGFDWPGWQGSFAKVEEEVREVNEAIRVREANIGDVAKANAEVHAELGDLLLACVNLARKIDVDAEQALVDATHRFEQRFELVEDRLAARGKTPAQSTLDEMDALWNDVKRDLKRDSAAKK
jgi:MazG family protein